MWNEIHKEIEVFVNYEWASLSRKDEKVQFCHFIAIDNPIDSVTIQNLKNLGLKLSPLFYPFFHFWYCTGCNETHWPHFLFQAYDIGTLQFPFSLQYIFNSSYRVAYKSNFWIRSHWIDVFVEELFSLFWYFFHFTNSLWWLSWDVTHDFSSSNIFTHSVFIFFTLQFPYFLLNFNRRLNVYLVRGLFDVYAWPPTKAQISSFWILSSVIEDALFGSER